MKTFEFTLFHAANMTTVTVVAKNRRAAFAKLNDIANVEALDAVSIDEVK